MCMAGLTYKQQRFCEEYMVDGNATQAAIRAGYSEKTAVKIGSENLIKLDIAEKLKELKKAKQECTGWNMWRAVKEYEDVIKLAKENAQFAPAVAAISKLVDLHNIEPAKKMQIANNITINNVKDIMNELKNEYFGA